MATAMDQALDTMMSVRIPPPQTAATRLVGDILATITRRRGACYGSLQITDDQARELAVAIASNVLADYEEKAP